MRSRPTRSNNPLRRASVETLETRRLLASVTVGTVRNTTASSVTEAEADIAVNPLNTQQIFAVSNVDGVTGLRMTFSNDGGTTWNSRIGANGSDLATACCDARVAYDYLGNLYMVYLGPSGIGLFTVRSTNNGASFTAVDTRTGSGWDNPSIDVGYNNRILIQTTGGGGQRAITAQSTGLGTTGAFSITSLPGVSGGGFGDCAVLNDGSFLYTYHTSTGGQGPATLPIWRDADGPGAGGWTNTFNVSTNVGGFDFIPAQNGRSIDAEPEFAVAPAGSPFAGRVYMTYTQEKVAENNDTDVMLIFSDNGGVSWSTPIIVNDDGGTRSQFLQSIAVDPTTGAVALFWHDARNDIGTIANGFSNTVANDEVQVYGAISTTGGVSFDPNFQITAGVSRSSTANSSTDFGDWTGLDFQGGILHPIWADNSLVATPAVNNRPRFDLMTSRIQVTVSGTFSISGNVYTDRNANASRDGSELALSGQTVYIDTNNNSILDGTESSVVTPASGNYTFSNLATGNYTIRTVLTGLQRVTQPAAGFYSLTITTTTGSLTNQNIGITVPAIRGAIYYDFNSNGTQDVGDTGQPGLTAFLDLNTNGVLDGGDLSQITGSQGEYSFDSLALGSYTVRIAGTTAQTVITQPAAGSYSVTLSAATPVVESRQFGVNAPYVSGLIYNDINGNGAQDGADAGTANVRVYLDTNNNAAFDSGEPSVLSTSTGTYFLGGLALALPYGSYLVRAVAPANTRPSTASPLNVNLIPTAVFAANINFGFTATALITGTVYNDQNNNASLTPGEPGIPNTRVYVDSNGNGVWDNVPVSASSVSPSAIVELITFTNPIIVSGSTSQWTNLSVNLTITHSFVGDLTITLVAPGGTRVPLITRRGGSSDGMNLTLSDSAAAPVATMPTGQASVTGSFRPESPLSALNGIPLNGLWGLEISDSSTGDSGTLNNWSFGGTFTETNALSTSTGAYSLPPVNAGTYRLRQVALGSPWIQTEPAAGFIDLAPAAGTILNQNFGNFSVPPPSLVAGAYNFNLAGGPTFTLSFTSDVVISAAQLTLTDLSTSTVLPTTQYSVSFNPATDIATVTFTGVVLPDANYRLAVASSVQSPTGQPLANPQSYDFYTLAGDADRDRTVGFNDLLILAATYNTASGALFSQGDFNYDGAVNFADLLILAANYNRNLPASVLATRSSSPVARRSRVFSDVIV
jgi:subtilisin-like proprotein convertase family protein